MARYKVRLKELMCCTNDWYETEPLYVTAKNKTEARKQANLYLLQADLEDTAKIISIEEE